MARFRASLNLTTASNKRYTDEVGFGGVDYASPRMSVTSGHALDELNYMYRDGAVQKRYGLEIYDNPQVNSYYYPVSMKDYIVKSDETFTDPSDVSKNCLEADDAIYNIWYFNGYIIINQGGVLFRTTYNDFTQKNKTTMIAFKNTYGIVVDRIHNIYIHYTFQLPKKRLNAFVSGDKLYILTGEYLLCLEVNDGVDKLYALTEKGNPYVPTTTLGIIQAEAETAGTRQTYEQPNMLTDLRINGCVSDATNRDSDTLTRTFTLDSDATSLEEIHISTSSFPYSNHGTYNEKITTLQNSKKAENTFYLPMCGQSSYYKSYTDDGNANRNYILMMKESETLDFSLLDIVMKDGSTRSFVQSVLAPSIAMNGEEPESQKIVPTGTDYDKYNGSEQTDYIRETPDSTGYYVRIFGNTDGLATLGTECKPTSGDLGVIWGRDCFLNSDGGFYNSYRVIIYALENDGKTWDYCCFSLVVTTDSFEYQTDGYGKTDVNDFVGNIIIVEHDTQFDRYGRIPLALLAPLGKTIQTNDGEDIQLQEKAGLYQGKSIIVGESTITPNFIGKYHTDEVTLVGVSYETVLASVKQSKKTGVFSKTTYPFNSLEDNQKGYLLIDKDDDSDEKLIYGYYLVEDNLFSQIVLLYEWQSTSIGESDIEVKFHADKYADKKGDINKCTFGILFGTKGYKNRLFVSGNSDKPTYDWHTDDGEDNDGFDYFPETSVAHYGTDTAVVGYGVVSDGKLLVVKEATDREPTIYYRTATYSTATSEDGSTMADAIGSSVYTESYPMTQTNSHIGGLDSHLFADFNGDSLFVDNLGRIVGLDNEGTTYDNQRVASSRSSLIDTKLKAISRSNIKNNCLLASIGDELYYFTPNATYYSNYNDSYGWYPLGIENVISICHMPTDEGETTLFGTSDGRIMEFMKGRFTDNERYPLFYGDVSFVLKYNATTKVGKYVITVSDDVAKRINEGGFTGIMSFYEQPMAKIVKGTTDFAKTTDGRIAFRLPNSPRYLYDGMTISYIAGGSKYSKAIVNAVIPDDVGLDYYEGYDWFAIEGSDYSVASGKSLFVYYPLNQGNRVEIARLDGNSLVLRINGAEFDEFDYSTLSITDSNFCIMRETPVKATYITAPYLSSGLGYRKVVDSYTIVSDMGCENELYVKSITNNVTLSEVMEKESYSVGSQVDYSGIEYDKIDYTRYDLPHTQTLLARFYGSFLAFSLASPKATNSTLTRISYLYHYAGKTYGKS